MHRVYYFLASILYVTRIGGLCCKILQCVSMHGSRAKKITNPICTAVFTTTLFHAYMSFKMNLVTFKIFEMY